ncbi:uncharacterized protein [Mytilus edulis]|uniref:uncharacterized protein n=1 Tax=Mytilus edulis TaxID=6550 RepID=UPI0039EFB6D9
MANPLFQKSKEETLEYDAYIAYCEGNYKWVYGPLRSFLEERRNYKLLLSDRGDGDVRPGQNRLAISNSISKCKKMILIISNEFVNNEWTSYEATVGIEHFIGLQAKIIVISLESITKSEIPQCVMQMVSLDANDHIRKTDTLNENNIFWKTLDLAMKHIITPNISLALYDYMCHNIVGTEEHVKTIRLMNTMRDNFSSSKSFTIITSGSYGEGLEMRGSDLDIMQVRNYIQVNADKQPDFDTNTTYLSMDTDDVKPGFTQLRLEYSRRQYDLQCCEEHNGKHYISSALYKGNILLFGDKGRIIHGPCLTNKRGDIDFALSLHCKTWISSAENWITRSGSSWPSHNVTQSIINHGVLFVPIGVHGSPTEDLEWRVSFSVAEKLLINTFTHTQLMCYALLKIILKDVIANDYECKDLLCSYFLKTIIFWISEEQPSSVWQPDNLIPCFMRCFSRLVYCVEHSVCLHYFIPENNLFENKIEGRARDVLLKKINTLYSYGWRCILFSDQISNFDVAMWNFPIEPFTLYVNDVKKIVQSRMLYATNSFLETYSEGDIFNTGLLHNIWWHHFSLKQLYAYYMSRRCRRLAQRLPLDGAIINNKYQYKRYTSCLSTLLMNVYHDAVSGWLMVASLFYKTKQYRKALYIIRYSISKCTRDKLFFGMILSDIHYQSLKLQTFAKKSVAYLLKIMFVDSIRLITDSTLTPDELSSEGRNRTYLFPAIAYAYFLSFICHYHLNNVRQCQDSLEGLELVIAESYLLPNWNTEDAYTLLGIALELHGDKESARQAFLKSVELSEDESHSFPAWRRLYIDLDRKCIKLLEHCYHSSVN